MHQISFGDIALGSGSKSILSPRPIKKEKLEMKIKKRKKNLKSKSSVQVKKRVSNINQSFMIELQKSKCIAEQEVFSKKVPVKAQTARHSATETKTLSATKRLRFATGKVKKTLHAKKFILSDIKLNMSNNASGEGVVKNRCSKVTEPPSLKLKSIALSAVSAKKLPIEKYQNMFNSKEFAKIENLLLNVDFSQYTPTLGKVNRHGLLLKFAGYSRGLTPEERRKWNLLTLIQALSVLLLSSLEAKANTFISVENLLNTLVEVLVDCKVRKSKSKVDNALSKAVARLVGHLRAQREKYLKSNRYSTINLSQ